MKILTTVKKVVDVELTIHIADGVIVEDGLQYVANAWDENAVETSVQLKENNGAETTLVSIGAGDHTDIIRRCYAMGIENTHGSITPGKAANLIITESMTSFGYMPYSYGTSQICKVIINGKIQ